MSASIEEMESDIAVIKDKVEKLEVEVLGSPGSQDSGLKTQLIKLNSSIKVLHWIGGAIGGALILDFITRLIKVTH